MTIKQIQHLICISILGLSTWSTAYSAEKRPNILYIFTDDQSYKTISCYEDAYPYVKTPNIDRLAENGIRFTQAYIGAKCVPSRATALTGRLQFNVGKRCTRYWPEDFRKQGYTTGMIGKWHWGLGAEYHQHGTAWDWSVVWDHNQPAEHKTYYLEQSVNINGGEPQKLGGYSTDRYTDYTVEFINEQKNSAKPWYFWLCYGAVHGPYTPAERHEGAYKNAPKTEIPSNVFGPRPDKPRHLKTFSRWKKTDKGEPGIKGVSLDAMVKKYNEAVLAIDDGLGRIIKALEDSGQLDNTIIVFAADQGYAWGEHGLRGKINPYDASIRSPMIISAPKRFPKGKVCTHPVNGPDVIRTFHSLAGVTPGVKLDGRDFTKLLKQPDHDKSWTDRPMIQTYTVHQYDVSVIEQTIKDQNWESLEYEKRQPMPAYIMLNDGRYKYVRYIGIEYIEELFDLQTDPRELTNLAVNVERQQQLASMRKQTLDAFRERGATFVDILPPHAENKAGMEVPDIPRQESKKSKKDKKDKKDKKSKKDKSNQS